MVYKDDQTTARIFKRTKTLIKKAIALIRKDSKGRITEAVAIDEALKEFLSKKR